MLIQVKPNIGGRPFGNNSPLASPRSPQALGSKNNWSLPICNASPVQPSNNYANYESNTLPRSNAPGMCRIHSLSNKCNGYRGSEMLDYKYKKQFPIALI